MSSTLAAIRAGLTTNVTGHISGVNMNGYLIGPINPPCVEIDFPSDSFVFNFTSGSKSHELDLIVRGIVDANDPASGQALLDTWLDGSGGMKAAIESDKTLGGAVDDLLVTQATGHRRLASAEQTNAVFLCAEWTVHMILND